MFLSMLVARPVLAGTEQEVIYALHLDAFVLSDSVSVYERDDELFLPIGELASLLSLAIHYDGAGRASGYILDESRTFRIDVVAGTVQIRGASATFDKNRAIVRNGDLYVAQSTLSNWFPVNIVNDRAQQILQLSSREKLPLQQLLERTARFQNLKKASIEEDPSFPDVTPPYRLLAPPVIDFASSLNLSGNALRTVQQSQSLIASGDIAALNATVNLATSNDGLDRADFSAGRIDSHGELLGPLRATRYALGAVQTPAFAGISNVSNPMYGFLASNRPTTSPSQFSSHDIQGPIPPGWDVELYYNGTPVAYQAASKASVYQFNGLPLKIGLNDFRVVLHGPNGETRIEHQQFLLDGVMVQPGKVQYSLGANRELIKPDKNGTGVLALDIGLTNHFSGFVGALSVADKVGRVTGYADAGLKGTLGANFLTLDHVRSSEGGSATLLTLKGYASGLYTTASQVFLDKFVSEIYPLQSDPIFSTSSFKLEGSLPLPVRMPFGLESTVEVRRSGDTIPTLTGRLSGELQQISVSEQLSASYSQKLLTTLSSTQVGTNMKDLSLRGQINYTLTPTVAPSTIQLTATKDVGANYQLSGQVSHTPASGVYDFTAGVAKRVGSVGFTVNAGMSSSGTYSVSSQLSVSVGTNPRTGSLVTDAFPMSSYGGLAILAYVDKNGNGVYDQGEPLLEGVHFFVNGAASPGGTGRDGVLLIRQLAAGMPLDISVAQETIPEPFLVPVAAGYRIEPRQGVISAINFNFVPSGEVDGLVQLRGKDGLVPVSDVHVSLLNKQGKVVASTMSEKSGFFLFQRVAGGAYTVRLAEGEAARLSVFQENAVRLTMPADGDMLSDNNVNISRQPAQPSALPSRPAGDAVPASKAN